MNEPLPSASRPAVLFAGGGSGGHISPGLAVAEALADCAPHVTSLFVCSERPIDAHMLERAAVRFVAIPARPPSLQPRRLLRFVRAFHRSRRRCEALLREEHVGHVVALGGFVAAPAVAAARRAGVPITLLNLDRPPGRANRWIARRCTRVWTAVDLGAGAAFAERVVGLPIRRVAVAPGDAATCRFRLGLDPERPTLLVTGASQGAASINELMAALSADEPGLFRGWQVLHLAGRDAEDAVREGYDHAGVAALVLPFLDEIGLAWGAASLALSRAGANSVAEAAANAVPTLFVPYPYHRDQHQRHNAQPLVDLGGAAVAEDRHEGRANARAVGPVLRTLMTRADDRHAMRDRLLAARPPDAAAAIAARLSAGLRGAAGA